jgi:hypothetical protein
MRSHGASNFPDPKRQGLFTSKLHASAPQVRAPIRHVGRHCPLETTRCRAGRSQSPEAPQARAYQQIDIDGSSAVPRPVPLDDGMPALLTRQIEIVGSVQAEDRNDNEAGASPSNDRDPRLAKSGASSQARLFGERYWLRRPRERSRPGRGGAKCSRGLRPRRPRGGSSDGSPTHPSFTCNSG